MNEIVCRHYKRTGVNTYRRLTDHEEENYQFYAELIEAAKEFLAANGGHDCRFTCSETGE